MWHFGNTIHHQYTGFFLLVYSDAFGDVAIKNSISQEEDGNGMVDYDDLNTLLNTLRLSLLG